MPEPRDPVDQAKRHLRASMKAALAATSEHDRLEWSTLLCARLDGLDALASPSIVAAFLPLPLEPDLTPLLRRLQARGIEIALPRAGWSDSSMQLAVVHDLDGDVVPTRLGLREPRPELPTLDPDTLGAILVPGLAFDDAGHRLGRGGGFYDRFLGGMPRARRIGVAFDLQRVPRVPAASHDARVHAVATPSGVFEALDL